MIIRRKQNKNFTVIGNELFNDERLSLEACGLLCWLRSRPNDWNIQLKQLERRWGCGRERMQKIMRELISTGWVLREASRTGGRGTFAGIDYVVLDEPQIVSSEEQNQGVIAQSPQSENPSPVPGAEKPESGFPESEKPESENPTAYKELTLPNTESPLAPPAGGEALASNPDQGEGCRPTSGSGVPDSEPGSATERTGATRDRRGTRPGRRGGALPSLTVEAEARYRQLVAVYPVDGVRSARHPDAQAAFAQLTAAEQAEAIRQAGPYADLCRRREQIPKALQTWIRHGFDRTAVGRQALGSAAPVSDLAATRNEAGLRMALRGEWPSGCSVLVLADSPEGAAWETYFRPLGVKPRWMQLSAGLGAYLPSKTPPARSAA